MKKVWVMTRRAGFNFGSSLQAYAVAYVVDKLGFENQIIDFDEYRFRGKVRLFIFDCMYFILNLIPCLSRRICDGFYQMVTDSYAQRRKFKRFEKEFFNLTDCRYKTVDQLALASGDCDALICGSDQIWSPVHFNPLMFLCFSNKSHTRTIAYAPSFGVSMINYHRDEMAALINRIDCLSIRERQGAVLIKELTGREAFVALDPTLLLDRSEWERIVCKMEIGQPYILCYFLQTDDIPYDFIKALKDKTGFKIINLLTNYSRVILPDAVNIGTVSPDEFLGLVSEASYVCTNSFHGTIFSIQFAREFFVFERFGSNSKINQNSRIDTLLSIVDLRMRLISIHEQEVPELPEIDYSEVSNKLSASRRESISFLKQSLS